jgi:hypothetical protein
MPYPRHFSFRRWQECPRCHFDWPLEELWKDTTGWKVCPKCYNGLARDNYVSLNELPTENTFDEDYNDI